MKKNSIITLLWTACIVKAVHWIMMIMVIIFQEFLGSEIYGLNSYTMDSNYFYIPVVTLTVNTLGAGVMLLGCILIRGGLKKRSSSAAVEFICATIFSGIFVWTQMIVSIFEVKMAAIQGGVAVIVREGCLDSMLEIIAPVSRIATAIFIFALGMSTVYKKIRIQDLLRAFEE